MVFNQDDIYTKTVAADQKRMAELPVEPGNSAIAGD
jgi:hypothetical protein